jgi:hypothetical protein
MRKPVDNVTPQLNTVQLRLLSLQLPLFLRTLSKNTWLAIVFLAIALWLTGPRTNAGAFEFARILVPSEARQLLLAYTQLEFANTKTEFIKICNSWENERSNLHFLQMMM